MKNDLTAEEWLTLDEFLRYGVAVTKLWEHDGVCDKKLSLLHQAELKIQRTAAVFYPCKR